MFAWRRLARVRMNWLQKFAGVHHDDDVFEKLIRRHKFFENLGVCFRRRIPAQVQQNQALFIHVPKNAGTSIAKALYGYSPGHKTAYFYRKANRKLFDAATRFAVLRDPIDRFLSAYSFIQNGGGEEVVIEAGFAAALKQKKSVDSILDFIETNMSDIYQLDHVLRPQSWYLMDNAGNLIVENIFVLGLHDKELRKFLDKLGVPVLQVLNKSRREPITLTPSQLQRVRAIYQLDSDLIEQIEIYGPTLSQPFSARCAERPRQIIDPSFFGRWANFKAIGILLTAAAQSFDYLAPTFDLI